MTDRQVFAAFARQEEADGHHTTSRRKGNVLVLYSYETPIAYHEPADNTACFDPRPGRHSVTTGIHAGRAQGACDAYSIMDSNKEFAFALAVHGAEGPRS